MKRTMRRLGAALVAVLVSVGVLVVPAVGVDPENLFVGPTFDVTNSDLPEFDRSWIPADMVGKVRAEKQEEFFADMERGWRACQGAVDQAKATGQDFVTIGNSNGACGYGLADDKALTLYLKSFDVGAVGKLLPLASSHYGANDPLATWGIENDQNAQVAAGNAARSGASGAGQALARFLGGSASAVGVDTGVIDAVSNPAGQVERLVNQFKADSLNALAESLQFITRASSFEADASWWRSVYAGAAGMGLILLAGMCVVAVVQGMRKQLPAGEVFGKIGVSALVGFVGMCFTPVFAFVFSSVSDGLANGVAAWLGTDGEMMGASLLVPFNQMTQENSPMGLAGVIIMTLLFLVAAISLMVLFAAQLVALYGSGSGLGLMWGMVTTDEGARRLKQAVMLFVALMFAKPLIYFFIGVMMRISSAYAPGLDAWEADPTKTFYSLIISVVAILGVCFAPVALTRFAPLFPSGAMQSRSGFGRALGGGLVGGAVGGMAGVAHGAGRATRSGMNRLSSVGGGGPNLDRSIPHLSPDAIEAARQNARGGGSTMNGANGGDAATPPQQQSSGGSSPERSHSGSGTSPSGSPGGGFVDNRGYEGASADSSPASRGYEGASSGDSPSAPGSPTGGDAVTPPRKQGSGGAPDSSPGGVVPPVPRPQGGAARKHKSGPVVFGTGGGGRGAAYRAREIAYELGELGEEATGKE